MPHHRRRCGHGVRVLSCGPCFVVDERDANWPLRTRGPSRRHARVSARARHGRGGARLPLDLDGGARRAVRRLRLAVSVRGRRAHPGARRVRVLRSLRRAVVSRRAHGSHPARHGHLPGTAAQPGLHGEARRRCRLPLGRTPRLRCRSRLARRGVPRARGAVRAPGRPLPRVPGGHAATVVRPGVDLRRRVLRAAGMSPVPEADPAAAPADLLRRRERRRHPARRRPGSGLVPLQPRARRRWRIASPSSTAAWRAGGGRGATCRSPSARTCGPPISTW